MTVRYLLDTNVVSEPLRPRPDPLVLRRLAEADGRMAIASVVWHELVFGVERLPAGRRRAWLADYLRMVVAITMPVLPYDEAAAAWHARERARLQAAGHMPPFADGQIAAIAATHDLVLVSRNTLDFSRFSGLQVQSWFTPTA